MDKVCVDFKVDRVDGHFRWIDGICRCIRWVNGIFRWVI